LHQAGLNQLKIYMMMHGTMKIKLTFFQLFQLCLG